MTKRVLERLQRAGRIGITSDRLAMDVDQGHAGEFGMSKNTLHQHIYQIRRAGYRIASRSGIGNRYRLEGEPCPSTLNG